MHIYKLLHVIAIDCITNKQSKPDNVLYTKQCFSCIEENMTSNDSKQKVQEKIGEARVGNGCPKSSRRARFKRSIR
jgi:hypothetical protein